MFKGKKVDAIRTIQDAFQCCGFTNSHDMAWPFQDKTHDQHACENMFGRKTGCMGAWKAEEQHIAGILIGVVAMVFIWQVSQPYDVIELLVNMAFSWQSSLYPPSASRGFTKSRLIGFRA